MAYMCIRANKECDGCGRCKAGAVPRETIAALLDGKVIKIHDERYPQRYRDYYNKDKRMKRG